MNFRKLALLSAVLFLFLTACSNDDNLESNNADVSPVHTNQNMENEEQDEAIDSSKNESTDGNSNENADVEPIEILNFITITDGDKLDLPDVVGTLNNRDISKEELDRSLLQEIYQGNVSQTLTQAELAEAYQQAFNAHIGNLLFEEALNDYDYNPTEEEIEAYISDLAEVLGDGVFERADSEVREIGINGVKLQQQLDEHTEEVAEQEVRERYDEMLEDRELLPYEDIKEDIKRIMEYERQEETQNELISSYRKNAKIQSYLE